MLSREWRCSWSSADTRCSNYIWVINIFIAYKGATYIRGLRVHCSDVTIRIMTYQITGNWIEPSTVYLRYYQRRHQSPCHWSVGNPSMTCGFPRKRPVTRNAFSWDDVIMVLHCGFSSRWQYNGVYGLWYALVMSTLRSFCYWMTMLYSKRWFFTKNIDILRRKTVQGAGRLYLLQSRLHGGNRDGVHVTFHQHDGDDWNLQYGTSSLKSTYRLVITKELTYNARFYII